MEEGDEDSKSEEEPEAPPVKQARRTAPLPKTAPVVAEDKLDKILKELQDLRSKVTNLEANLPARHDPNIDSEDARSVDFEPPPCNPVG